MVFVNDTETTEMYVKVSFYEFNLSIKYNRLATGVKTVCLYVAGKMDVLGKTVLPRQNGFV